MNEGDKPIEELEPEEALPEIPQEDLPEFHPDKIRVPGGFMLRLPALCLDAIVVGFLANFVSTVLQVRLEEMEPKAWVVGYWITFLYFFLTYSPLAGGRSIGKRLMQLYPITASGKPPGYGGAAFRSLLITTCLMTPAIVSFTDLAAGSARALLVFFALASVAGTLLMGIMVDPFKQGLHDRATGVFVIQKEGLERFLSGAWHKEMAETKGHLRNKMRLVAWANGILLALMAGGFFHNFLPRDNNGFLVMGPVHTSPDGTAGTRYIYWKDRPLGGILLDSARIKGGVIGARMNVRSLRVALDEETQPVWLMTLRVTAKDFESRAFRKYIYEQIKEDTSRLTLDNPGGPRLLRLALHSGPDLGIMSNFGGQCEYKKPVWVSPKASLPKGEQKGDFCDNPAVKKKTE